MKPAASLKLLNNVLFSTGLLQAAHCGISKACCVSLHGQSAANSKVTCGGFGAKHIASHLLIDPVLTHVPICCRHKLNCERSLQRGTAVQHAIAQHDTRHDMAQHSTARHGTERDSTGQHSMARHSTAQHSTAQHSTAQHSTARNSPAGPSRAQHGTAQHSREGRQSFNIPAALAEIASIEKPSGILALAPTLPDSATFSPKVLACNSHFAGHQYALGIDNPKP